VFSAAILIGGRARRLEGRFKPLLPVNGRTILERELDALRSAGADDIALVGRWVAGDKPPVAIFADALPDCGALGGLYTALLIARTDRSVVLAGDMPFVSAALVERLSQIRSGEDGVIVAGADATHPLCACYRRSVARHFKTFADRRELRIRDAVERLRLRRIDDAEIAGLGAEDMMLMNVNTAADYQRAQQAARLLD
jgi:molybdopterin-guanine dinucleotide biosynthesis protein A